MRKDMQRTNNSWNLPSRATNREFDNFIESFFGSRSPLLNDWPAFSRNIVADIQETDKAFILIAEVPGVPKEEIDISVDGNLLTISAEHHEEEGQPEQARGYRREYQSFRQSYALPSNVDAEQIEAHCENGMLEVTLPKMAASITRRIDVKERAENRINSKIDTKKEKTEAKSQVQQH